MRRLCVEGHALGRRQGKDRTSGSSIEYGALDAEKERKAA